MKLKEILEENNDRYYVEVYVPKFGNNDSHAYRFHTDFVDCIEDYTGEEEVIREVLMDREDYNNSVLANTSERAEDYMEENERILCVLVKHEVE